jgi:hypothetical protein
MQCGPPARGTRPISHLIASTIAQYQLTHFQKAVAPTSCLIAALAAEIWHDLRGEL